MTTPIYDDLFCSRAMRMKRSEIRELLKLTQKPDMISFAGGLPNPGAFPVEKIREIIVDVLNEDASKALQYGSTEGVPELREQLASRLKRIWGIDGDKDSIIITTGSQQGLDLIGRLFIGDGNSNIIMEAPTYLGALNAFHPYEPQVTSVPMDDNGLNVDHLEECLKSSRKHGITYKFLYTVPTFHNPAGVCMSLSRRKRLLDLSHEYDFLVIEDDPYGELRYSGDPLPALASMDREKRVIYLGTFSKTLVPGFRVAWTLGPKPVIDKMVTAKQAVDLCTPAFNQCVAMEYLRRGYIDEHLKKIIALYGRKQRLMVKAMDDLMPKQYIRWPVPDGGMFLWATLDPSMDAAEMFPDALKEKVAYVTGQSFFADGSGRNCMRLNYTHPSDDMVVEGVKRLSKVVAKWGKEKVKASKERTENEVITGV